MIPPLCLDPPKGARVLDMCAAPGGKTFMLLEAVRHEGLVIANDLDRERLTRLVKAARNLVPHGMASALELRIGDGRKFHLQNPDTTPENTPPTEPSDPPPSWHIPSKHQGKPPPLRFPSTRTIHQPFTHILLDTPCTGTGTISLREPTTYKHWSSPTSLQYLQKLTRTQKSLLQTGLSLLAPSGTLVYSTCAISVEENEQVVSDVLEEFGEGKVEIVDVGAPERGKAFGSGVGSYGGRRFVEGMERCLRVFPDGEYEGFFVCKLRKVG
ncbi:hypothetical protein HK097_005440 [Rhizophlyctis rosea]|uniref:SAM-dependent MTase RsmB/NOP-type domain-containing protein n=1 Tax=Rhizophlyctis rosea TaxID=64517 RepID=A0AAD5X6U5_9FUNG|nr:hypothetical protein HK097_005440 [Rhizophlyctis rosea]